MLASGRGPGSFDPDAAPFPDVSPSRPSRASLALGPDPARLRGRVAVPDAFFKIIVDEQDGRLRTLAFLIPQEAPAHADPARYLTTIAEIEARTGLDFLAELEDAAEREVESRRAGRVW